MPGGKHMYYIPGPVPATLGPELLDFLRRELQLIKLSLDTFAVNLQVLHAAPDRPAEGMIRYADGTDWNPGGGKGVYVYDGATWVKL